MSFTVAGNACDQDEEPVLHILFVCTGNICRSPIAERLAAAYCAQHGISELRTSSAGTRAVIASPIHPYAAVVVEKLGGDASEFAARQLSPRIASDADLLLTMTEAHRDYVLGLAPHKLHHTFTLSEAAQLVSTCGATSVAHLPVLRPRLGAHKKVDIADPIGQDADVFAFVGSQIAEFLSPVLELCRST